MIHINVAEEKNPEKPVTKVRFSPLKQQFSEVDSIFEELRELVKSGDYTLGKPVEEFELLFAEAVGAKYAIGGPNYPKVFLILWPITLNISF